MTIAPGTKEKVTGKLDETNLATARKALIDDGVVILEDIVDLSHLDVLRERMIADVQAILAREDTPYNFNKGNIQQDPPPFRGFLFRDVLLNDLVIEVTQSVLGPGLFNSFYSGNTAIKGGDRQPVHADIAQLWPNLEHPTPPYALVVNVPVVDMDEENGATEIWPGTHKDTTYSIQDGSVRIAEKDLSNWREHSKPFQVKTRRGSVIIRDPRMWHAGMPNHTEEPRPMIAMIHWVKWWTSTEPVEFAEDAKEFFDHPVLRTNTVFVAEPQYLLHNQAFDVQG